VTKEHSGKYTCKPYNKHGNNGTSDVMKVIVQGKKATTCVAETNPHPRVSFKLFQTPASHINWDYRATLLIAGSTASGENIGEFECLINDDVFSKTSIRRINTTVINSDLFNVEVEIVTDNTRQHVLRYRKHGDEWDNLPITPLTLKLHSTLYTGKIQIPGLSRHESYELQVFSEQKVEAWHPEDDTLMISAATTVGGGVTVSVAIMIIFTFSLIYHS